ncbi:M17 family metallopeptidase [uncultured Cocleimonas sp.]|uniref:leucyl aminopeptidase family protein n=1 Tax=uncultured Cocleimonas sp. TaxID=1051587 RepID=UPI00263854E9|nr:leucyl aminopeptidase family protein [uncultured Cocleimonas sp.]
MSYTTENNHSIPLNPVSSSELEAKLKQYPENVSKWVASNGFEAKPDQFCVVPDANGALSMVFVGVEENITSKPELLMWSIAGLPKNLPAGQYHLETNWSEAEKLKATIGWGLGDYSFDFFKADFLEPKEKAVLRIEEQQLDEVNAFVDAFTLVRDMVNTPANHMMPEDMSSLVQELAEQHDATFSEVVGDDLLEENFPAIHAVGRASDHAPRLLQMNWGDEKNPVLSLVGKGVCFDTGGLDLKPSKFMRNMKKDMGGAAHVLGLAHLIMSSNLPVRLQVLIPSVDNAVSGDAYRPGDIIDTRAHKTVEIDNTDAEGRVVLCDALALACEQTPDLIIDFATLTGAARVAVGTEIPALFSNTDSVITDLQKASKESGELLWPLPLHQGYRYQLESAVADMVNSSSEGYGGAITAALYLNEFVTEGTQWAHFDVMAYNTRDRVGRPKGGEAMGLLATFTYLESRYS